MKKNCMLLCLLIILVAGCSQNQSIEDRDYYNIEEGVNEMEERIFNWENSVRVAQEAFYDLAPEIVERRIVHTIVMNARVNGIIRMEEIESHIIAIRIFEIESEDGLIFHVYFAGNHIDSIVDPETRMPIYEIIE